MNLQRSTPEDTKLTICVWHPFTEWQPKPAMARAIRTRWPLMRVVHLPDYTRLEEELPDTDIFIGYSIRPQQLQDAKRLKWIHSTAAGVAQLMYPELRDSGVVVTNPRGIFAVPMAEHIVGLMLALARNFPDSVRQQDRAQWAQQALWDLPQHLTELNGQLLLIVGFGSIGKELARRARAFDMRVWGVNRTGKGDTALAERILPVAELPAALPQADFVVLAAPETPETRHLIGAEEIALMKAGARLINVARGSLLDEAGFASSARGRKAGWRGSRCGRQRTAPAGKSVVESAESVDHAAYERDQRPALGAGDFLVDGTVGALVRWPRIVESRGFFPRLLSSAGRLNPRRRPWVPDNLRGRRPRPFVFCLFGRGPLTGRHQALPIAP